MVVEDSSRRCCVKLSGVWKTCESDGYSWGFRVQEAPSKNPESGAKLTTNDAYFSFVDEIVDNLPDARVGKPGSPGRLSGARLRRGRTPGERESEGQAPEFGKAQDLTLAFANYILILPT